MRPLLFLLGLIGTALTVFGFLSLIFDSDSEDAYVYYLNFKPESDSVLQELAKLYTKETGVEVKVLTPASGSYGETLKTEMESSKPPTLFVEGSLQNLKEYSDYAYDLTGTKVANQLSTDEYKLVDSDGKLAGIGYCYETFGIIVNKALLTQAGHSVDEITDYFKLKDIVEDIHSRASSLNFDAFTSSGLDSSSSWRFAGHLTNVPLYYESKEDGFWTETPAKIRGAYLGNYRNLFNLYIKNSAYDPKTLANGGFNAQEEFGNKKAVFYQNGNWEYDALVNNYKLNPDDLTMIPLYGGVGGEENAGLSSGTENYWIVNNKAPKSARKATLDFMYWLVTNSESTKKLATTFGYIPFKKAVAPDNVFLEKANQLEKEGKYNMKWVFNLTPNVDEWRKNLVAALVEYAKDSTDANWDLVTKAYVDGWEEQYKNQN